MQHRATDSRTLLPAEWAPQAGILLTWPHAHGDWQSQLGEVERTYIELAVQISHYETVVIACYDEAHRDHVHTVLARASVQAERIRLYIAPSNDIWARDHGPVTIYRNDQTVLLDFRFNGWGCKYPCELDDQVTDRLYGAGAFGTTRLETVDLVLEGGSIDSDGQGTLLTTDRCLLSASRNGLDRATLEYRLAKLLGIERFLWLEHGHLAGDDTDSHIDTLARFCDPWTIAYQACDDPSDEHFASLWTMRAELERFHTTDSTPYRLVPLPLPAAKFDADGRRLPAGYANFLILNGAVLVPTYDDPADTIALERLRVCFPDRRVLGIPCLSLIQQYGSLHCVTMQLPAGVLPP